MQNNAINLETGIVTGQDTIEATDPLSSALTRYNKDLFFGRFNQLINATNDYDDTVEPAIQSAQIISYPEDSSIGAVNGIKYREQARQINMVADRVRNAGIGSVVIEAAHTYLYDDLDDPRLQNSILAQSQHAAALTKKLRDNDVTVRQVLFVDDYNPDPSDGEMHKRLDVDELVGLANTAGFAPEMILHEGSMVPLAKNMMDFMDETQNLLKIDGENPGIENSTDPAGSKLMLARRNIELYRIDEDMITCAMLDAALTVVKFRNLGEAVINILPRRPENQLFSYKGQQKKMRTIIGEHFNVRVMPVFNLFTGDQHTDAIAAGAHHALRKPH
jgi:hypothetical protein